MKDFSDYLNEAAGQSLCWWLQQPTPKALTQLVYLFNKFFERGHSVTVGFMNTGRMPPSLEQMWNKYKDEFAPGCPPLTPEIVRTASALGEHFETGSETPVTQDRKNRLYQIIKPLLNCSRADWAGYSGVAYRGTVLNQNKIKAIKWAGVKQIEGVWHLYGDGVYESRYEGQSWTTNVKAAQRFSKESKKYVSQWTNKMQFPAIVTATLTKSECLFSPKGSSEIVQAVLDPLNPEHEVLRLSNAPKKCTISVPLALWLHMMADIAGGYREDPEWLDNSAMFNGRWTKELKGLFFEYLEQYFVSREACEAAWKIVLRNIAI